jgi:hypothetical protein
MGRRIIQPEIDGALADRLRQLARMRIDVADVGKAFGAQQLFRDELRGNT